MPSKYHQKGGIVAPGFHINISDVLKRGWVFDMGDDGYCKRVCRTKDATNPLRCHCGRLAVSKDHLHPYYDDNTLCYKCMKKRDEDEMSEM